MKKLMPGQLFYRIMTACLCFGIVFFIIYHFHPFSFSSKSPCFMNAVCHLYCPGCGGTRALYAMLTGHLIVSLRCNPLVMYMVFLFLYYYIGTTLSVRNKGRKIYFKPGWWMLVVLVGLLFWTFILRNILAVTWGIDYLGEVARWWR